jgi:hypothetical protein
VTYHNHVRLDALVIRPGYTPNSVIIRAGPGRNPYENHDFTPNVISLGHRFKELWLLQSFTPPKNDTNPWPLQYWDVDLRIVGSQVGSAGIGLLFPGQQASVVLQGTGFDLVIAALAQIAGQPDMAVGIKGHAHGSPPLGSSH